MAASGFGKTLCENMRPGRAEYFEGVLAAKKREREAHGYPEERAKG